MFNFAFLFLIALLPFEGLSQESRNGGCPSGFNYLAQWDKCYKVYDTLSHWYKASSTCKLLGSQLAVIRNSADSAALKEVFETVKGSCSSFYSAAKRPCRDKEFVWVTGSGTQFRLPYTNWAPTEPNNFNGIEDCIQVQAQGTMEWNDLTCNNALCFVCEFPKAPLF